MPKSINIAVIAGSWGSAKGGVNAFNADFCTGLAAVLAPEVSLICLVDGEVSDEQTQQARQVNVQLIKLPSNLVSESDTRQALTALMPSHSLPIWWVGQDTITGSVAQRLRQLTHSGKLAIFQHMDYAAYQIEKKRDGNAVNRMSLEQAANAKSADQLFGVGPLLTATAKRLRNQSDDCVKEIIPGLARVAPSNKVNNLFQVITFGRMGQADDRIKQGKLAAASVAIASKNITRIQHRTVWLKVIGFPGEDAEYKAQFDELNKLVNTHAGRAINIIPISYTEDRNELFDHLAQSHVSLMLSLHEGFGLAGWEAIASAVPLILSTHSGLFHLLEREHLDGYVFGVDIKAPDADAFSEEDIETVATALEKISARQDYYQERAEKLREELFERNFTWESAGRAFCAACEIPMREENTASTLSTVIFDSALIERESLLKSSDEDVRKSLSAYQEKLKLSYEKNGIQPSLMLRQIQSMRSYYTATTMGGVTPAPMSEPDYAKLIQQVNLLARDFKTLPTDLLERVRTNGMYFDSDTWDGIDAAESIEHFPLPTSIQSTGNDGWGYMWETIGRLLKTMIAFLHFAETQLSDGYAETGWLLGRPIAQPAVLLAWANRGKGEPSSIDVFVINQVKGKLQQIGKFVARNSKLRQPQLISTPNGNWSLFATDGARVYEWDANHSTPIADHPIEKGFILSYLAFNRTNVHSLYCVTNERHFYQLDQKRKLGRAATTTRLCADPESGDIFGIAIRNKVASGLDFLSIQNLSNSEKLPSVFCVMANDEVNSPSLVEFPNMDSLLQRAGIIEFHRDSSLAFFLPTGDPYHSQDVRIARVLTEHKSTKALVALVIRESEQKQHHLLVLTLQQPSQAPMMLSTDLRIFDAIVVERKNKVLLFTTLLPGGNTHHCIAVWQLDAQGKCFELLSLGHGTDTGDATDLHIVTDISDSIVAIYRYADYSTGKPNQTLWMWTWPEETPVCLGELPPECGEGESTLFQPKA